MVVLFFDICKENITMFARSGNFNTDFSLEEDDDVDIHKQFLSV